MNPVTVTLVGAGSRGFLEFGAFARRYGQFIKFAAVAEPDEERRNGFAAIHQIPSERCFSSFEELFAQPQMSEGLINATTDILHYQVTAGAVAKGYHVFQEKPLAGTIEDCLRLQNLANQSDRIIQVGHCLRFTPFYQMTRKFLDDGKLGKIITATYEENVTFDHMAHSFVRGNYGRCESSSPMIIAKSCHDLDILLFLLNGRKVKRLSSFGALSYFRAENAPADAPKRCTDGCPHEPQCPYSAIRIYTGNNLDIGYVNGAQWQLSAKADAASRIEALQSSKFGRCVFHCDNDVVDHQTVNLEFEDHLTVSFSMQGFGAPLPPSVGEFGRISGGVGRTFTFFGSAGVLNAPCYGHLEYTDFLLKQTLKLQTGFPEGGHGGGDFGMLLNFADSIRKNAVPKTSVQEAVMSHLIGFAAEKSRLNGGEVIQMDEFIDKANQRPESVK